MSDKKIIKQIRIVKIQMYMKSIATFCIPYCYTLEFNSVIRTPTKVLECPVLTLKRIKKVDHIALLNTI